eukprot:2337-Alexandrium_andersonii.AAC.1
MRVHRPLLRTNALAGFFRPPPPPNNNKLPLQARVRVRVPGYGRAVYEEWAWQKEDINMPMTRTSLGTRGVRQGRSM